ncbi:MAG: ParB/RepB/Spo0J family partition protein [Sedimentisphaerales bacterium]
MQETKIENRVSKIALDKLVAHPDNPNRMSKTNFAKLVRNIERTGRYEPLVVRPCTQKNCHSCASRNPDDNGKTRFQIINGHHRWQALRELGYKTADAIVWDIGDRDADILLATLNRLGGSDILEKKLALLKRLNQRMEVGKLAKLLPLRAGQIERLTELKISDCRKAVENRKPKILNPLVFFVNDKQQKTIENALSLAQVQHQSPSGKSPMAAHDGEAIRLDSISSTKAAKNAAALTYIAQQFLNLKLDTKTQNNY